MTSLARKTKSSPKKQKDEVSVAIRARPLLEDEHGVWNTSQYQISQISKYDKQITYNFDHVFSDDDDNRLIYSKVCQKLVFGAMQGISGTVLAYGQTSSGKTYTMMGVDDQPGFIPQAVDDVFSFIREQASDREYLLRVAYVEIYNETIRDLLSPDTTDLRILEDRRRGTYVSPLIEEIVTSPTQVMKVIRKGEANRSWGTTDYNAKSSRSHTILQIIIESRNALPNSETSSPNNSKRWTKSSKSVCISQLNLIDLAGSEKADTDLDRRKEGAFINKSLLTLGNVISKITEDVVTHIPFRDSKLTRVLQTSLSGKSMIAVVCTVNPSEPYREETLNTLKFASRVKKVPVKAEQNNVLDDEALIQQYKQEIADLKNKLIETSLTLEKERSREDVSQLRAERQMFEEQLHKSHMVRLALKERIEHLTKMILTSQSITPNSILDWNAPTDKGNKRASVIVEGLLPSSPSLDSLGAQLESVAEEDYTHHSAPSAKTAEKNPRSLDMSSRRATMARSNRLSRQMTDKEFYQKHISEIVSRDEKIKQLHLLLAQLKDKESSKLIAEFENTSGHSVFSVGEMSNELERHKKDNAELEIIVQEQQERMDFLEALAAEKDDEIHKLKNGTMDTARLNENFKQSPLFSDMLIKISQFQERVHDLETQNRLLKATVSDLRRDIRRKEEREFEQLESTIGVSRSSAGVPSAPSSPNRGRLSRADSSSSVSERIRELEQNLDRLKR